mgnify:CR=1 FL=1
MVIIQVRDLDYDKNDKKHYQQPLQAFLQLAVFYFKLIVYNFAA